MRLHEAVSIAINELPGEPGVSKIAIASDLLCLAQSTIYQYCEDPEVSGKSIPTRHLILLHTHSKSDALLQAIDQQKRRLGYDLNGSIEDEFFSAVKCVGRITEAVMIEIGSMTVKERREYRDIVRSGIEALQRMEAELQ